MGACTASMGADSRKRLVANGCITQNIAGHKTEVTMKVKQKENLEDMELGMMKDANLERLVKGGHGK